MYKALHLRKGDFTDLLRVELPVPFLAVKITHKRLDEGGGSEVDEAVAKVAPILQASSRWQDERGEQARGEQAGPTPLPLILALPPTPYPLPPTPYPLPPTLTLKSIGK